MFLIQNVLSPRQVTLPKLKSTVFPTILSLLEVEKFVSSIHKNISVMLNADK